MVNRNSPLLNQLALAGLGSSTNDMWQYQQAAAMQQVPDLTPQQLALLQGPLPPPEPSTDELLLLLGDDE